MQLINTNSHEGQTKNNDRILWLDLMRGLAIFSVVIQHCTNVMHFQFVTIIGETNMGVFFFISAYLLGMKEIDKSNVLSFLKKKTLMIFIPFLSWTYLVKPLFFIDKFSYYDMSQFISAFTHPWLWFLLTLYFYDIVYALYSMIGSMFKGKGKKRYNSLFLIFIIIVLNLTYKLTGCLKMEALYIYYFIIGIYFIRNKQLFEKILTNNYIKSISFLFICLVSCYFISGHTTISNFVLKFFSTLSMIVCLYVLCTSFSWNIKLEKYFLMLGRESLAIYVLHWGFTAIPCIMSNVSIFAKSQLIVFMLISLYAVVVCLICSYVHLYVKKVPLVNKLLFGR